ncbi:MAG: OmpA family protein [Polyangiaceae bacterium]|jgi:peptidoglycan-associated lipoprotein
MKLSMIFGACSLLGLAACGGPQAPVATPTPVAAAPAVTSAGLAALPPETLEQAATSGSLHVSEDILRSCNLPDADAYFRFDSARLEKQDIPPLNTIAVCFTTGTLKGRSMKLVGHADPRGATGYNMSLGQSRADGVEGYLGKRGLAQAKVETTSRGAIDATGTDEAGWEHDRRVDVMLAQ